MGDEDQVVEMEDVLWPSPEMRQRAIEKAIELAGAQIYKRIQDEVDRMVREKFKETSDALEKSLETSGSKLASRLEQAQKFFDQINAFDKEAFLSRCAEVEQKLSMIQSDLTMLSSASENDRNVATVVREMSRLLSDAMNNLKGNYQFTNLQGSSIDQNIKARVIGDMISETLAYLIGNQSWRIDAIISAGNRIN